MRKRWDSFDLAKGLACIAVVFIHYNFTGNLGLAVKSFCRFGVPVFFITSGFFFLNDGKIDEAKVVRKIRHILKICVYSGIFYAFFTIIINRISDKNWSMAAFMAEKLTAPRIVKFFITNDPFVYSHLWFLLALLYCYFLLLFLFPGKSCLIISLSAPLLITMYSCLQEFGDLLGIQRSLTIPGTDQQIYLYNLFIFRALPFFFLGILLNRYQEKFSRLRINRFSSVALWFLGGGIAIWERFSFQEAQFFVGTYLMLFALFVNVIKYPAGKGRFFIHVGRDLSLFVYILHIAVGRCMDLLFSGLDLRESAFYIHGRSTIILITSLLIAEVIFQLKRKVRPHITSVKGPNYNY